MVDINLTQADADALISMPKFRVNAEESEYPGTGGSLCLSLASEDKHENFLLDISRGRIDLLKGKYQNRARQVVILVRLDFGGSIHRNPDGTEIPCPHLHLYREGLGDKWAVPAPSNIFKNMGDLWQTLGDFMKYCNIIEPPIIRRGLFT